LVFTLPEPIAALAYQNKRVLYDLLFRASAETLRTIAADPKHLGAEIGFITILHTWGQNLLYHPHVHCVVPGGGISPDGERWIACRPGFFLPVRVLSRLFRRLFLDQLRRAFDAGMLRLHGQLESLRDPREFAAWLTPAAKSEWVVYAKPPFGGAERVLDYLGRYTHRVAISNNRLLSFDGYAIQFRWKDYRHDARHSTMTLTADEFIRRFLLHVLPDGFKRIRSYGWLANCHRADRLATCRRLLGVEPPAAASVEPGEDYLYWQDAHPKEWLFPGSIPGRPITRHAVGDACELARKRSGITKPVTPHSLRHAFATHLLEAGTDVHRIQLLMGHRSLSTTSRYLKVATSTVCATTSPFDLLPHPAPIPSPPPAPQYF
jgi:hypothetical protein